MLFLLHYTENSHSALSPFCTLDDPFLVDKIIFHPTFTLNILFNLEICFITKIEWVMCAVSCWPHQRKEKTDWPSLQTGLRVVKVEKAIQKYSMKKWKKKKKLPMVAHIRMRSGGSHANTLSRHQWLDKQKALFTKTTSQYDYGWTPRNYYYYFLLNHKPISKRLLWLAM